MLPNGKIPAFDQPSALRLNKNDWMIQNPAGRQGGNAVGGLSVQANNAGGSSAFLDLVGLPRLMARTSGRPEISIGLIDGPVVLDHPDLAAENIREVPGKLPAACADASDAACAHGTFIAGILVARRTSVAPAICPGCNLLVRPIFSQAPANGEQMPSAFAGELADAIIDRKVRARCAGRSGHQPGRDGNSSDAGGHQRSDAVRLWRRRTDMVGVSGCERCGGEVCRDAGCSTAADRHRAALAERLGKLPGNVERAKLSKMLGGAACKAKILLRKTRHSRSLIR